MESPPAVAPFPGRVEIGTKTKPAGWPELSMQRAEPGKQIAVVDLGQSDKVNSGKT